MHNPGMQFGRNHFRVQIPAADVIISFKWHDAEQANRAFRDDFAARRMRDANLGAWIALALRNSDLNRLFTRQLNSLQRLLAFYCMGRVRRSSMACRSLARPRCRRTRWWLSVIPRISQASAALSPSTSRSRTTACWRGGRSSIACLTWAQSCLPAMIRSGSSISQRATDSLQNPRRVKRLASTTGTSSSSTDISENNETRRSRVARRRALLARIASIQDLSAVGCSSLGMPSMTASHVSCTTSSAVAPLPTKVRARPTRRL